MRLVLVDKDAEASRPSPRPIAPVAARHGCSSSTSPKPMRARISSRAASTPTAASTTCSTPATLSRHDGADGPRRAPSLRGELLGLRRPRGAGDPRHARTGRGHPGERRLDPRRAGRAGSRPLRGDEARAPRTAADDGLEVADANIRVFVAAPAGMATTSAAMPSARSRTCPAPGPARTTGRTRRSPPRTSSGRSKRTRWSSIPATSAVSRPDRGGPRHASRFRTPPTERRARS